MERTAISADLSQTEEGQPLTKSMLRERFGDARKASGQDWQLRDLLPKAATDVADLR